MPNNTTLYIMFLYPRIVPVLLVMHQLVKLECLTELEIITVMMKTTTLCVDLMVEIVATMIWQIGIGIAMIVNA